MTALEVRRHTRPCGNCNRPAGDLPPGWIHCCWDPLGCNCLDTAANRAVEFDIEPDTAPVEVWDNAARTTVTAVVATLRQIASWGVARPETDDEWYAFAAMVESAAAAPGGLEAMCCPMCQEVTCDDDCPLAPVRPRP